MAIESVLYKNDNDTEEIMLDEMELRQDYQIVRKNLYCAFVGCESKIEYVPKGKRIAHFKTWPKSNHSPDCFDAFQREQKTKSQRNQATTSIGLTDKHINNVLKSFIKSSEETEEEKQSRLQKQRESYKKKKRQIIDNTQDSIVGEDIRPTTDSNADIIGEGTRAPSVKRRFSISFLSEDDLGTATALKEKIESISIEDDRVIILLQKNDIRTNVYFEKSFFASSVLNVDRMFKVVEEAHGNGDLLTLWCVGNIERRKGELCLVINGQNHIRVNKMTIERFTFIYNNPKLL